MGFRLLFFVARLIKYYLIFLLWGLLIIDMLILTREICEIVFKEFFNFKIIKIMKVVMFFKKCSYFLRLKIICALNNPIFS